MQSLQHNTVSEPHRFDRSPRCGNYNGELNILRTIIIQYLSRGKMPPSPPSRASAIDIVCWVNIRKGEERCSRVSIISSHIDLAYEQPLTDPVSSIVGVHETSCGKEVQMGTAQYLVGYCVRSV